MNKAVMNQKTAKTRYRNQVLMLLLFAIVTGAGLALVAGNWNETRARNDLEQRSRQVLALHKEAIFGLLDKFRLMTVLVARRPETVTMFVNREQSGPNHNQQDLQNFAGRLAAMSGAEQVRLALPDGQVIAQSTLAQVDDAVLDGQLRIVAMQDRLGRATIFSPTGGTNTYAFAASVRDAHKIVGIVNVDVGLQVLENAWALSEDLIFVTDHTGAFIVGNQLAGLLPEQYFKSYGPGTQRINARISGENQTFLARGEHFPHIGWTLNVLIDETPALSARSNAMIFTGLIVAVLTALAFIVLQRRLAFQTRLEAEKYTASLLEKTVATRTAELSGSNQKLQREFDERVAAEAALKKAQASLIQSAKLAAIGQMSTALAHEYNQPLAAIRSYADNARVFLEQNKSKNADENLHRIAKMTERMAELSRTLKTFARKPRTKLAPVALAPLIQEAIVLVGPSAKKLDVSLHMGEIDENIKVMAGHVRLSQVIVNLLSNAIDAVADTTVREVFLSARVQKSKVVILVEDTGPGVPHKERHKIFDAFVTSKDVGEGLGLGLSISYNIVHDFGGEISVEKSDKGGAAFKVCLMKANKSAEEKVGD